MSALCKTGYVFQLNCFFPFAGFFFLRHMFLYISFYRWLPVGHSTKETNNERKGYRKGERNDNECSCTEIKCHINISWAMGLDPLHGFGCCEWYFKIKYIFWCDGNKFSFCHFVYGLCVICDDKMALFLGSYDCYQLCWIYAMYMLYVFIFHVTTMD